jgi:hypothetical protein
MVMRRNPTPIDLSDLPPPRRQAINSAGSSKALVGEQAARIEALTVENVRLVEENADPRRRLGQDPRSSSQPPPCEGLGKPAPRSLRRRSGRMRVGRPGHEGTTLRQVDTLNVVMGHEPTASQRDPAIGERLATCSLGDSSS